MSEDKKVELTGDLGLVEVELQPYIPVSDLPKTDLDIFLNVAKINMKKLIQAGYKAIEAARQKQRESEEALREMKETKIMLEDFPKSKISTCSGFSSFKKLNEEYKMSLENLNNALTAEKMSLHLANDKLLRYKIALQRWMDIKDTMKLKKIE